MINNLYFLETNNTYPYRNLAVEEYITLNTGEGDCVLFLWQNKRTVVIGRNQNAYAECDVAALQADGGYLVRRLSGGGAVFHDLGNLNFTFCMRHKNSDIARQSDVIISSLQSLGIDAKRTGRNDLTVDNRKFSGHAFFRSRDYCYHHGTLLLDTQAELMKKYLTPDKAKLASKGVKSVSSRVINLKEICPDINKELLSERLKRSFGDIYGLQVKLYSESELSNDIISEREKFFSSDEYIYGRDVNYQNKLSKRFLWGNAEVYLDFSGDFVRDIKIFSDCMLPEMPEFIENAIRGCRFSDFSEGSYDFREMCLRFGVEFSPDREEIFRDVCSLINEAGMRK